MAAFQAHIPLPAIAIAVIGGNQCSEDEAEQAAAVGRGIAEAGAILVCGGRGGVMAAACKGARGAGGLTIGLLPGEERDEANPDVLLPIPTGLGIGRNLLVINSALAVIAIGGRYGTLSEIAFALQLEKPLFGLGSWPEIPGMVTVSRAEEAVRCAVSAAREQLK